MKKLCETILAAALTAGEACAEVYSVPEGERIYGGYAVTVDGAAAPVSEVRCSAIPFNRRWPGHQRQIEQTELCVKAMHIDNCALNCDFLIKDGKVYVLEIAGRGGGANLMDLTAIYFGIDYHEMIVRCALGEKVSFNTGGDRRNPASYVGTPNDCMMLKSDKSGRIVRQENNNDPDDPDILQIVFDYEVGDEVRAFRVSPDRLGHVITKGRTLEEAQAKNREAISNIVLEIE